MEVKNVEIKELGTSVPSFFFFLSLFSSLSKKKSDYLLFLFVLLNNFFSSSLCLFISLLPFLFVFLFISINTQLFVIPVLPTTITPLKFLLFLVLYCANWRGGKIIITAVKQAATDTHSWLLSKTIDASREESRSFSVSMWRQPNDSIRTDALPEI